MPIKILILIQQIIRKSQPRPPSILNLTVEVPPLRQQRLRRLVRFTEGGRGALTLVGGFEGYLGVEGLGADAFVRGGCVVGV